MRILDRIQTSDGLSLAAITIVGLFVHICFYSLIDLRSEVSGDTTYYLAIAHELAAGHGYFDPRTYWKDVPSFGRAPGWPFALSYALQLFPSADPDLVTRLAAGAVNLSSGIAFYFLGRAAFRSRLIGLLSGLGYALHPQAVYLASSGLSEPLFVMLVAWGIVGLLSPRLLAFSAGAVLLGTASLVRPNFVLLPFFLFALLALYLIVRRTRPTARHITLAVLGLIMFEIAPMSWSYRNYQLCGHFPVMSSIRGETLYGGNNDYVANDLPMWGYWVFPDEIPGTPTKRELASKMTEYELDEYYYEAGRSWIRSHIMEMPRLIVGKLTRAYVPVPWVPSLDAFAGSLYRFLLFALFIFAVHRFVRPVVPMYELLFWAMLAVNLVTIVVFYGCSRFAFVAESFMIPYAAQLLSGLLLCKKIRNPPEID